MAMSSVVKREGRTDTQSHLGLKPQIMVLLLLVGGCTRYEAVPGFGMVSTGIDGDKTDNPATTGNPTSATTDASSAKSSSDSAADVIPDPDDETVDDASSDSDTSAGPPCESQTSCMDESCVGTINEGCAADSFPDPGANGELQAEGLSAAQVTVIWVEAVDESTPAPSLRYQVFGSLVDNVGNPNDARMNGTPLTEHLFGVTRATVSVVSRVDNYINVVVEDDMGNLAAYTTLTLRSDAPTECEINTDCLSVNCTIWYRDRDGDGFGNLDENTGRCNAEVPPGFSSLGTDCCDDPTNRTVAGRIHPGQEEFFSQEANLCGVTFDYDCSGAIEFVTNTPESVSIAPCSAFPDCQPARRTVVEDDCGGSLVGQICNAIAATNSCMSGGVLITSSVGCH